MKRIFICAYLGVEDVPADPSPAVPFLVRYAKMLDSKTFHYDIGLMCLDAVRPSESLLDTPHLSALLDFMGGNLQTVNQQVEELSRIKEASHSLLWHLKTIKGQTDHTVRSLFGSSPAGLLE